MRWLGLHQHAHTKARESQSNNNGSYVSAYFFKITSIVVRYTAAQFTADRPGVPSRYEKFSLNFLRPFVPKSRHI